jgi:uncharacterized membrane protein
MIWIVSILALVIFIFITRAIQRRRDDRRSYRMERKQELFERTLESVRKSKPVEDISDGNEVNGEHT